MEVGIRRITGDAVASLDPHAIVQAMQELGPGGGDFVIVRADSERAAAIEQNLLAQLFAQGAVGWPATRAGQLAERRGRDAAAAMNLRRVRLGGLINPDGRAIMVSQRRTVRPDEREYDTGKHEPGGPPPRRHPP